MLFIHMAELVHDDVVDAILRRLDERQVQVNPSFVGATAPARSHRSDSERRLLDTL